MAIIGFVHVLPTYLPYRFRPSACTQSTENPAYMLLLLYVLVAAAVLRSSSPAAIEAALVCAHVCVCHVGLCCLRD